MEKEHEEIIEEIYKKMLLSNLPAVFVDRTAKLAREYEGIFDLMYMWNEELSDEEKDEIIADIQDLLDDEEREPPEYIIDFSKVDCDVIENIIVSLLMWKAYIKMCINKSDWGLDRLSVETGIPIAALNRCFNINTKSLIKYGMFKKIIKVLKLDNLDFVYDYRRFI
jgi:hypothetical protein